MYLLSVKLFSYNYSLFISAGWYIVISRKQPLIRITNILFWNNETVNLNCCKYSCSLLQKFNCVVHKFKPSGLPKTQDLVKSENIVRNTFKRIFGMVTLVPGADALHRLTRDLTVELEELVSYCSQDLDLTETTWGWHKKTVTRCFIETRQKTYIC